MKVRLATHMDRKRWDDFVWKAEDSSIFHLFDWKEIFENSYHLKTFYLMAEASGHIKGILPLVFFKGWMKKGFLLSFPISEDGGICAENKEAGSLLLESSIRIAEAEKSGYIEFRHNRRFRNLISETSKVTMQLQLESDPQRLWKSFKAKVRNQVRKAKKSGLKIETGTAEDTDRFYEIFVINMRNLGMPTHSKSFFKDVMDAFGEEAKIFSVVKGNRTVASGFTFAFKDRLAIPWASSIGKYDKFCPNHLLYWEILRYACNSGYRYFNFGRSIKGSGTFRFKRQWGAQSRQLYRQYYLVNTGDLPENNPQNPRYTLAVKMWKRLPIFVAEAIGPRLMRGLSY